MNRRSFLTLAGGAATLAGPGCSRRPRPVSFTAGKGGWPAMPELQRHFHQSSEFFRSWLPENFSDLPAWIKDESWIGEPMEADEAGQPWILITDPRAGGIRLTIRVGKDGQLLSAGAHAGGKKKWRATLPQCDMATAVERAMDGLKRFGWAIPPDMQLSEARPDQDGRWHILWHPEYDGVPEERNEVELDKIAVVFDNNNEGVEFTRHRRGPPPAETVPRLTRMEAITLATKALPRIMITDLYRSRMAKGFSPVELRQVDLRVTVPNWILHPAGHPQSTNSTIIERRLCWRATFLLRRHYTLGGKNDVPAPHEAFGSVNVFVDAVNGEIAGANMQPLANNIVSLKYGN